jgi:hypothetical protein
MYISNLHFWYNPVAAPLLGSRVRIQLKAWMFFSLVCCASSGLSEESYRLCVCVWHCVWCRDLNDEEVKARVGPLRRKKRKFIFIFRSLWNSAGFTDRYTTPLSIRESWKNRRRGGHIFSVGLEWNYCHICARSVEPCVLEQAQDAVVASRATPRIARPAAFPRVLSAGRPGGPSRPVFKGSFPRRLWSSLPPSSSDIRNNWNVISTPPYAFMAHTGRTVSTVGISSVNYVIQEERCG